MAKKPAKKVKKRATKYEKKLAITGTLDDVLKVSIPEKNEKSKEQLEAEKHAAILRGKLFTHLIGIPVRYKNIQCKIKSIRPFLSDNTWKPIIEYVIFDYTHKIEIGNINTIYLDDCKLSDFILL